MNFFDYKHLRVIGKDKLLMEYKTAQRIGAKTISFKPAEEDNRLLKAITVLEYFINAWHAVKSLVGSYE